jgi:hypothetical protein
MEMAMRYLCFIAMMALCAPAFAQGELQMTFTSCDQFEKRPDGWRARAFMILPCGVPITNDRSFGRGAIFCGRDLAAELDAACE